MGYRDIGPQGEQQARQIIDYLNSHPGYSKAWDTFKQTHPDMANASGQGAASSYASALDYFGGQWDTNAGRTPGDPSPGSFQDFTDKILSGDPGTGGVGDQPGFVADPTGKSGGGGAGSTAPGFKESTAEDAGKDMYAWAGQFKTDHKGKAPTRKDFVDAWGDLGGQMVDYVVSTNTWPDEATFVQRAGNAALTTPPGGSIGKTYAPKLDLPHEEFNWRKDFDERKFAADEAKRQADEARARGDSARADAYLAIAKTNQDQASAIQVAGLTGNYNGNPTLAMQQFTQNQANFEKQFGLQYDQFTFQKDQFAKQYGLDEAQVTGMFAGNPTLAMQQFTTNKDQFNKNFGLSEAGVTGTYGGKQTEAGRQFDITTQQRQDEIAYNAARAGNPLKYLQATRGIGAPVQNYAGMPSGNLAPGYTPPAGGATTNVPSAGAPVAVAALTPMPLTREDFGNQARFFDALESSDPSMQAYGRAHVAPDLLAKYDAGKLAGQGEGGNAPGYAPGGPTTSPQPAGGAVIAQNMAPGYQQPQMPGNIQAVVSGAPLPAYGLGSQPQPGNNAPGNPYQLRAAGAQAQANEGSLGKQSRYEAYELAGVRGEDLADNEERIRKNLGSGLAPASYRARGTGY